MTKDQVLRVVKAYKLELGIAEKAPHEGTPDDTEARRHIAWMCEQIPEFVAQDAMSKVDRWLGFIQGGMWLLGIRTIDQMRDDNR